MITKEEVKHVAKLARLGLTEKELEKFQKELASILAYFEKLKEVDISGVEPTSHSIKIENLMRDDEIRSQDFRIQKKLIEMAPDKKEEYIKVKPIF